MGSLGDLKNSVDDGVASDLEALAGRMRGYAEAYAPLLDYAQQRVHLGHVIVGLTSDLERKSSEPIAVMHGLPRRVLQNFVGLSEWAWEPLRRQQRREVSDEIGVSDGTLIIDPSAVPKKGTETVGVARQWCGRLGKVDSCVVGVHAVYVGRDGQAALVDSQLFLPGQWDTAQRRAKVHIPDDVAFATKVDIGEKMVKRMSAELPFQWVTADEEYGRSASFRDAIRELGKWYVIEVPRNTMASTTKGPGSRTPKRVEKLARLVKNEQTLKVVLVAHGEKQPIQVAAAMLPVTTTRRDGRTVNETMLYTIDASGDEHFFLAHLPVGTTLETAVRRAGLRHRVEEVFAEAKGEVGMDHFECRAWHGWHHHMTLVQMAHWFLVREQRRMGKKNSRNHHQHGSSGGCQDHGPAVDANPNPRLALIHPQAQ